MRLGQVLAASVLGVAVMVATAAPTVAAPEGPPNYGVVEPIGIADTGCPWPDSHNTLPAHEDAQKCLPQSIPWSGTSHGYGVRIISDTLTGAGDDTGQVTFRCQSRVGLQYKVTVQKLQHHSTYTVTATRLGPMTPYALGSFTTDKDGNGILNGTLHLERGSYGFLINVKDTNNNTVLSLAPEPNGTGGFGPGVVGLSVLDDPANIRY